jgi:flagellar biosynthesis regulator FlbT
MRQTLFIITLVLITNFGFSQETNNIQNKSIDPKLVGCWKGSEVGQQKKGVSKYWISCRFENGTSTVLFITINKNGEVIQETENGKWWVENGKYYEFHTVSGMTDIYEYETIENSVNFKAIELMGKKNPDYSFFDFKIEED